MRKWIIILLSAALLLPFLGSVHLFDWDEINFAESAREMIVTGDYSKVMIGFKPFHEKPPLFMWLQTFFMNILGVGEYAARLPNAIAGVLISFLLFQRGKKEIDEKFGITWVIVYLGSFLPFFYFKTGIIDPIFNAFIFWSILKFFDFLRSNRRKDFLYATVLISLAVLTKGPVGLLLSLFCIKIYLIYNRNIFNNILALLIYFIFPIAVYLIWYFSAFGYSLEIITQFIDYHIKLLTTGDSGHSGPIYYHLPILLFGVFPASFFAISKFLKKEKDELEFLNLILFLIVLIVFSIVQTKIVHYSSLAYFPITFFAAKQIYTSNKKNILSGIFGIIISIAIISFPLIMQNADSIKADKFTEEILRTQVKWGIWEMLPGFIMLIGSILFIIKNNYKYLFISVSLTCFAILPLVAPKIEKYTQAANIEFWEKQSNKDVNLMPLGYKSYSHYFYGNLKPSELYKNNTLGEIKDTLLYGNIEKDTYFSVKFHKYKEYKSIEDLNLLYQKNGFIFLKREANNY